MAVTGVFFLTVLSALGIAPTEAAASDPESVTVLVLHSYHPDFQWTTEVQQGVEAAAAEFTKRSPVTVDLRTEFLDAKRFTHTQLFDLHAQLFARKYGSDPPDVIVSIDNDALDFLFQFRNELFGIVPVVFGGLDADAFDAKLLEGRREYTGVVEALDLGSTLDLIRSVQPYAERVAVVHDRTTSGLEHRALLEQLAATGDDSYHLYFLDSGSGLSHAELLEGLDKLPYRTPVLFCSFYRDRNGTPFDAQQILQSISTRATGPVYGQTDDLLGLGIIGGKLLSGRVHGESVARLAFEVLERRSTNELPVREESSNRYMADYSVLQRFELPVRRFPQETQFINLPTSFWSRYRDQAVVAAVGVAGLLALVALLARALRRARRSDRFLAAAVEQKELMMREMNHRIKNNLAMITSLVRLKSRAVRAQSDDSQLRMDDIVHQIDAIRIIHEKLYRSSDLASIEMQAYLSELLRTVFGSFSDGDVALDFQVANVNLPTDTAIPLGLIVNEVATNAIKHGFHAGQKSQFRIELSLEPPAPGSAEHPVISLVMENSGRVIPDSVDLEKTQTLGFRLLNALTDQLGGWLELERTPLTRFSFRFPHPDQPRRAHQ